MSLTTESFKILVLKKFRIDDNEVVDIGGYLHPSSQWLKNLLTRLWKNSILLAIEVKNNNVNSRNSDKVTRNLAKLNNLSNLFKSFIILFIPILKITRLFKLPAIRANNNEIVS